jgi:hypothetical protein
MYTPWIVIIPLLAVPSLAAPTENTEAGTSAWDAIKALEKDPNGHVHIADDGVIRSYDGNDVVISYVPLGDEQIKTLLANLPEPWQKESEHLHAVFDKVNGHDVSNKTQLVDPPTWLRPLKLARSLEVHYPDKSLLEGRDDWYCRGQPCTSSTACQFLGCSACTFIDQILPGGAGICI